MKVVNVTSDIERNYDKFNYLAGHQIFFQGRIEFVCKDIGVLPVVVEEAVIMRKNT